MMNQILENPAIEAARETYQRDGFCLAPPLVPIELIERALPRVDAVMNGQYQTGVAASPMWKPGDDPNKLRKIDQAHLADDTLFELITHPAIGRFAAQLTGAKMIQIWAVQLLFKPPGASTSGNVGWHQDQQYWANWWQQGSEVFTAWLALSDVTELSGPMRFVRGSHRWGLLNQGDFFGGEHDLQREQISVPAGEAWNEVPAVLPPGAFSFHHRFTYHGSGPNQLQQPRISFALHLRTENSRPVEGSREYYVSHLDEPRIAPIIYAA